MTPAPTRRQFLVIPWAAALGTGLAPTGNALALDFSLPKLEDLREKWAAVGLGATDALVIQAMGNPNPRTETQTMGVPHLTLGWKDIRGFRFSARFLAGRLYAKEMSDSP